MAGSNAPGTPSNHDTVKNTLKNRKIVFKRTKIAASSAAQFVDEWNGFVAACGLSGNRAAWDATRAQADIVGAFSSRHGVESNFNQRLFDALKRALGGEETLDKLSSASDCLCDQGSNNWLGRWLAARFARV
jgi:hypothetical protein